MYSGGAYSPNIWFNLLVILDSGMSISFQSGSAGSAGTVSQVKKIIKVLYLKGIYICNVQINLSGGRLEEKGEGQREKFVIKFLQYKRGNLGEISDQ